MTIGFIHVASLASARRRKRRYDAVLTIEDPGFRNGLRFHGAPHPSHLVLSFEDVDDDLRPRVASASAEQIEAGLRFGRENAGGSLLVHCKAGIARSTALALAIIADRAGDGREVDSVRTLLEVRPEAVPNLHVLALADDILGRGGRLTGAWNSVERSDPGYARHRAIKTRLLRDHPGLFAAGLSSGESGIRRFGPQP